MMPTTQQILASMQLALKEHVEPKLDDKWALSAMRSVDALLNHLQARVPSEGPMLHEDTTDLFAVLGKVAATTDVQVPTLSRFLADTPGVLAGYASVEALQAINHIGREAVGEVLELFHAVTDGDAVRQAQRDLGEYLRRHAERESPFFFPVFVGRPV